MRASKFCGAFGTFVGIDPSWWVLCALGLSMVMPNAVQAQGVCDIENVVDDANTTVSTYARYLFEGNTSDSSGNGWNPTNAPDVTYSTDVGQGAQSAQLDIAGGGTPVVMDSAIGNDRFVSKAWLMSLKPDDLVTEQIIMDEGNHTSGVQLKLKDGNLELTITENAALFTISVAFPDTNWHRVGITYEGGRMSLFIDGVEVGSVDTGLDELKSRPTGVSFFDRNGVSADGSNTSQPYTGLLDDVTIVKDSMALAEFQICRLPPLDCTVNAYMVRGSDSRWSTISLLSGDDVTDFDQWSITLNAIGYNVLDGLIYGYSRSLNDGSISISSQNADGSWTTVHHHVPGLPASPYNVGDVANGILYLINKGTTTAHMIDVDPASPTYLDYLGSVDIGLTMSGSDWAYNAADGFFYTVTDSNGNLIRYDIDPIAMTATATNLGLTKPEGGGAVSFYGAQYIDADGFMYIYDNTTGEIFRLDLNAVSGGDYDESQTVLFSTSTGGLLSNDGAFCSNASIDIDFGDAPDSYGTSLSNDGARHGMTGVNFSPFSSDLKMGSLLDVESEGIPTASANGDNVDSEDDEDGVSFGSPAGSNQSIFADVEITNAAGSTVTACCWLDIPSGGLVDGVFDSSDGQCLDTSLASTTLTFQWSNLPTDQAYNTYLRCRITSDSMTESEATGVKSDGEVEDYALSFNFTPTAVTIGEVGLESLSVEGYLNSAALDQLQALLASYGKDADGMSSAALMAALTDFLDPDGGGQVALFRWDTLEERGTIGFYVERQNQGQSDGQDWSRVNNDLLPGLITAPMGAEYQLLDPGAQPGTTYQYRLIELEADGNTREYGPFELQMP